MDMHNVTVNFPKNIVLEDGRNIHIETDKISDESLFSLLFPEKSTDRIAINLIKNGFHDATPSFFKGEKYSMARELTFPWELHIRLFNYGKQYGKIFAHVEISRKYFEHLFIIQPSVFDPFEFYKGIYKKFIVMHEPSGKTVKEFRGNYKVTLIPPENLIEWMPVVLNLYNNFSVYKDKIREIIDVIDYELHRR
ncbi:hypothetical protein [Ferroplasma sp.]|uniref:hypothetical protein n=1 Tax=Ferroplasma sp. TaxID=2591003 RepID=UPI00262B2798|nr:hypothetical protein [Ferroplasma sp.]